jgi:hypothetical protein
MTAHLSSAGRVPLAAGPDRSERSALRCSKHIPIYTVYAYDSTWRSYTGGLRRTESGPGHLRSMTCSRTGTMKSVGARYCSGGHPIAKRAKSSVRGAKHVDASSLLVILHYLLKNNKERSTWN